MDKFLNQLQDLHPALGYVNRAAKWTIRQVLGTTELERTLSSEAPPSVHALALESVLSHSYQLGGVYRSLCAVEGPIDSRAIVTSIVSAKPHLKSERVAENTTIVGDRLVESLNRLGRINVCKRAVNSRLGSKEPYSKENARHEEMLDKLWTLLMPTQPRDARMTHMWGMIGFQGKDPATDFRGMGILGLENLVYMAETHPNTTQRMLLQARTVYEYSFAIVGINLTGFVVELLRKRHLVTDLVSASTKGGESDVLKIFNEKYCSVFRAFHVAWNEAKPENIMSFGPVFDKFKEDVLQERIILKPVDDADYNELIYFKQH